MANPATSSLAVLQLQLQGETIGHLARQPGGATALIFDPAWSHSRDRSTLTLSGTPQHPAHASLFARPWLRSQGLHPLLANLLPEAGLRPLLAQQLEVPADDAFLLLAALGDRLPGAWQIRALEPHEIPAGVLDFNARVTRTGTTPVLIPALRAFAGSQPKLVPPDNFHPTVTADSHLLKLSMRAGHTRNEYTALQLARLAGIDCVDAELIPADTLRSASLPLQLDDEPVLAVRRFDRTVSGASLHTEDFAQVLFKFPQQKYLHCDTVLLGRLLYRYTPHGLRNVQEFARRMLVNVLLGNGDVHLKNWSLLYADGHAAALAPAYDLAFTQPLNTAEQPLALGGCSDWYTLEFNHFAEWGRAVGIEWRKLRPTLLDTVERARTLWPAYMESAPMLETHKLLLRHHWKSLPKKLQYGL